MTVGGAPGGTATDAAALTAPGFAAAVGAARVLVYPSLGSTMDEAHRLARAGAPAGTVVLADRQSQGRGRGGRAWASAAGAGVWLTLLERPSASDGVSVLSLRLGMALAEALAPFAAGAVRVKWPNDLLVNGAKLAGILVEARWHGAALDWVAIGVGVNCRVPEGVPVATATVRPGSSRLEVVAALVPAMRQAAARSGALTPEEAARWRTLDALAGRPVAAPVAGVVAGVSAAGALVVRRGDGALVEVVQGSVELAG